MQTSATGPNVAHGSKLPPSAVIALSEIRADALKAVEKLVFKDDTCKSAVLKSLRARLDAYLDRLGKIAATKKGGLKRKLALAKTEWLRKDTALLALLRVLAAKGEKIDAAKAFKQAESLTVFKPLPEAVVVRWLPKAKGGFRLIVNPGPMRRTQALMVRDALSMCGIDSEFDFSKQGEGEKALIHKISVDIENGYKGWWNPDIKDCFGSIRPGHFGWLPIDRRVIKNVFFVPECAGVIVKLKAEEAKAMLLSVGWSPTAVSSVDAPPIVRSITAFRVRRGLSQGSLLSPLLARAVVARELRAAVANPDISISSYCDDLFLGASSQEVLLAEKGVVTKHFSSLPAGPIELHETPVVDVLHGDFLGYRLEPGKGYGQNIVHCKPGPKRIARFKRALAARLKACKPDEDLCLVGERYWRHWFGATAAWTKVPELSASVSWSISLSYIDDYLHGLPMGVWKANAPILKGPVGAESPPT